MQKTTTTLLNSYKIIEEEYYSCSKNSSDETLNETYKSSNGLMYPINIARNLARKSSQTHFVFASDIELYPTPDFIPKFLEMVVRKRDLFENNQRKIFALPVFEILENETVPNTKTELQNMYSCKKAFWFHYRLCKPCHAIPNNDEWMNSKEDAKLGVFTTVKRRGQYGVWEAFYIGTNNDPWFDERLIWEGQRNKMTQVSSM